MPFLSLIHALQTYDEPDAPPQDAELARIKDKFKTQKISSKGKHTAKPAEEYISKD